MKNLIVMVLMCLSSGVFVQSWTPVRAEWYNTKYPLSEPGVTFRKIEVEKDTIYNGQLCSKLIGGFNCPWVYYLNLLTKVMTL